MKQKIVQFVCILILIAFPHMTSTTAKETNQAKSYKAGGTPISIPPPTTEFIEIGYDNREVMEIFVAPDQRLLCGFLLKSDLPLLSKGDDDFILSQYAMVNVPRRGEFMDFKASDYKELADKMKENLGDVIDSSAKRADEESNHQLKSLGLDEVTISLDRIIKLGCLFSKQDAYGFGMILPVSKVGHSKEVVMGCAGAVIRARNRMLFIYLYTEYKNDKTVKWLRKTTKEWADSILKANK